MPDIKLPDGRSVSFPDGTPPDVMESAIRAFLQASTPPQQSKPVDVARAASMPARGFNEAMVTTLGAPFDLAGAGVNLIGRGVNAATDAMGMGRPVPPVTTDYTGMLRQGLARALGPEVKPEGTLEQSLYGAGRGVGDAMSVAMPAAALSRTMQAGPVASKVIEGLAARPVMQAAAGAAGGAVTEATDNPWLGLATSMAVPTAATAAGRAMLPVRPNMDPERQRLIAAALQEGIPLTPAQATGSRPLRIMEGVMDTFPTTAGKQEAIRATQAQAFTRASLAKSGTSGDYATPEVIRTAQGRIGGVMNEVAARNIMKVTDDFRDKIKGLTEYTQRYMTSDQAKPLTAMIDDIARADKQFKGEIPGAVYMNFDSQLGGMAKSAEGVTKDKLGELRRMFRGAMDDSLAGEDKALWDRARRDYANLKVTQDAVSGAGEMTALGNVSPLGLRTALNRSGGREAYGAGFGDQNDLARIGQALLRREQDSGTAGRGMMQHIMTGGLGGMGGALASGGDPLAGAATAATILALPKAVQQAYHSRLMSNYLMNGLPGGRAVAEALPGIDPSLAAALLAGRSRSMPAPGN